MLFKVCARPADYHISQKARQEDQVQKREDGEEVGVSVNKDNEWHNCMHAPPSSPRLHYSAARYVFSPLLFY